MNHSSGEQNRRHRRSLCNANPRTTLRRGRPRTPRLWAIGPAKGAFADGPRCPRAGQRRKQLPLGHGKRDCRLSPRFATLSRHSPFPRDRSIPRSSSGSAGFTKEPSAPKAADFMRSPSTPTESGQGVAATDCCFAARFPLDDQNALSGVPAGVRVWGLSWAI